MSEPVSISDVIQRHLSEPETVFVFPSEIAARFWRAETARRGPLRAVREDRFVSWDTFKEKVVQERADSAPANRVTRMLFAASVMAENAASPFLSRLVDPRFAAEAEGFTSQIEGVLPSLSALAAEGIRSSLEPALATDIDELLHRYRRFLSEHGLFEPAWVAQRLRPGGRRYIVIHPELVTDFEEFRAALEAQPAVRLVSPAGGDAPASGRLAPGAAGAHNAAARETAAAPVLREYETSRAEIRDVCAHLETLLDEGVAPDDIAVTVCGEDAFLAYFEAACHRLSIPVSLRAGKPLTAYPAGRFFEHLRALPQAGFSLRALEALVLDRAVPWKEPAVLRSVVRSGIAGGCLRNYREEGRERDVWASVLAGRDGEGEGRGAEQSLYRRLKSRTQSLAGARSFADLYRGLYEFFGMFLDTGRWTGTQMRVFQSCLDVLTDLIEASERLQLEVPRPFDVWLSALRSRIYVPRETGGGVAVYPYRVAAGIEPRYHFILNASNARSRVLHSPHPFLRDDEKDTLGLPDRDLTDAYIAVYARSGRHVLASYGRESFSGPSLPPGWFAERELVQRVAGNEAAPDPLSAEQAYFRGETAVPKRVYPGQIAGIGHATATGFRERGPDWSQSRVAAGDTLARLLDAVRVRASDGAETESRPLGLSPTDLAAYESCPFGFLLGRLLRLNADDYRLGARAAADAGQTYHRAFEMLFRRIREHTGTFRAENVELYHGWVGELAAEITDGWARSHTSLSPAEAEALRLRLVESMHTLLDQDAVQFDGYAIEVLETYESVALDDGTVLGGRMDRRMATPDDNEAVIIDYKKRTIPKARELRVGEVEAGRVTRPQLALYAEILARLGRGVSGLYFYSVENEEYLSVFARSGGGILTAEELRAARAAAMEALERAIAGIKAGDFRFPDPWMGCESCDFPGICRSRFRTG